MPVKRYKLHSTAHDGKPQPCAFFLTGNGCRNGDNCKFAHVNPSGTTETNVVPPEEKSVVSSESGEVFADSGETFESNLGPSADDNPFEDPSSTGAGAKRKTRRGSNNDSPFPKAGNNGASEAKANPPKATASTVPQKQQSNLSSGSQDSKPAHKQAPKTAPKPTEPTTSKTAGFDFRSLNLPIADFALASASNHAKSPEPVEAPDAKIDPKTGLPPFPVPNSTEIGREWRSLVEQCYQDPRFARDFDFEKCIREDEPIGGKTVWIKSKPFGDWCKDHPQVIAIDCEMCETEDPVSKFRNSSALCRVSIVDAITDEILLNSLVKPEWPIVDYRTFINGITEKDLAPVQFTVRHCQAFMMALCSEETVIVGHAVHHDLKSIRMEHYCVADSSYLFRSTNNDMSTVSLKDLSFGIFKKEMPKTHDSVNDARAALRCVEHYKVNDGNVESIVRRSREKSVAHCQLFVHRIPKHVTTAHLAEMFLNNTKVAVDKVDDIDFSGGAMGKTLITFQSAGHTNLAFRSLKGDPDEDTTGRLQKKVFLRGGKYIRIRKMVHENNRKSGPLPSQASPS
ncbi:hypothetical protein ACA910_005916 [Epithemia clementina (nom. ined.)]